MNAIYCDAGWTSQILAKIQNLDGFGLRSQLWAKSTSILHLVCTFRPLAQQEFIECSTECRTGSLYTNLVVVMTNLSFSTALNDNSTALNDKSRK